MNQKSMPNKWLMFFILLISAITVSLSQLKISPVMGDVAAMLSVDANQASLLMSLFTVAGIFLSIPGAAVLAKTGSKNMLLILMGTLVLGNVLGAVTNSFAVVMISRIIEGLSYALIITVGIDMINTWFTGATVGTATGIFNTFAAAANFIGMNASVALYKGTGNLKTLWWANAILAAVCFVLVLLVFQTPKAEAAGGVPEKGATVGEAVKNPALLVTCLSMFCLAFVLFGFITCIASLFQAYGIDQQSSAFYASLNGLIGIPTCIISGIVIGKSGKPFIVAILGAA
ncbi:MFS transporter, partial [Bacteroides thetaiotaomicron]